MTDRELLELAAKAAGIRYTVEDDEYYKTRKFFGLWLVFDGEPSFTSRRYWNPLTDDGDAFRLMVDLRLIVTQYSGGVTAYQCGPVLAYVGYDKHPRDRRAAVRYAIVRAAAEIGRSLK